MSLKDLFKKNTDNEPVFSALEEESTTAEATTTTEEAGTTEEPGDPFAPGTDEYKLRLHALEYV